MLFAVAHWFGYGPRAATAVAEHEANLRRTHFARMERAAVELQEALRLEAPLWRTAGLDWRNLDALLGRVQTSARAEAACPGSRNGAPPLRWRDELIALVRVHYPASKLKVSWVSHFEETIRLLLEFLGVELQDLHKQVRRTLDRHPASPFVVDDESNVVRLPAPSRRT